MSLISQNVVNKKGFMWRQRMTDKVKTKWNVVAKNWKNLNRGLYYFWYWDLVTHKCVFVRLCGPLKWDFKLHLVGIPRGVSYQQFCEDWTVWEKVKRKGSFDFDKRTVYEGTGLPDIYSRTPQTKLDTFHKSNGWFMVGFFRSSCKILWFCVNSRVKGSLMKWLTCYLHDLNCAQVYLR